MLVFVVISLLVIMFNIFSLHLIELSRAYKLSLDRHPYAKAFGLSSYLIHNRFKTSIYSKKRIDIHS